MSRSPNRKGARWFFFVVALLFACTLPAKEEAVQEMAQEAQREAGEAFFVETHHEVLTREEEGGKPNGTPCSEHKECKAGSYCDTVCKQDTP